MDQMYCRSCSAETADHSIVCGSCGSALLPSPARRHNPLPSARRGERNAILWSVAILVGMLGFYLLVTLALITRSSGPFES